MQYQGNWYGIVLQAKNNHLIRKDTFKELFLVLQKCFQIWLFIPASSCAIAPSLMYTETGILIKQNEQKN